MVDFTLTDEQKDLRELAHNFAEKEIRPVAWEYDKDGTWPQEIIEKAWEVGLMNTHIPEAVRRPRPRLPLRLPDRGGVRLGLLGHRHLAGGQRPRRRPRSRSAAPRRSRRSTSGMLDRGAEARLLLPDRARRRLRRLGDEDDGRQEGRQVRPQRLQVLHHQRRATPTGSRSTPRPTRTPATAASPPSSSPRDDTVVDRQEGGQARPARLQHRDRSPSTRPRSPPTTCSARRTTASSWR